MAGRFNIYQGKDGGIYMALSNCHIMLTAQQLTDLRLDVVSLIDFDIDKYRKKYDPQLAKIIKKARKGAI
jgi:hypothetical protein